MIALLAGAGLLLVLLGVADAFSRAQVNTIKALLAWIAALGGLSLGMLLLLTGRWPAAIGALTMFGPLAWNWWQGPRQAPAARAEAPGQNRRAQGGTPGAQPRGGGPMTRAEAWAVLGLPPGSTEPEIRDAHRRLMRVAHPDNGGSDWVASRVNQARDLLLKPRGNGLS